MGIKKIYIMRKPSIDDLIETLLNATKIFRTGYINEALLFAMIYSEVVLYF